jgi:SAM-dependent methyltransferase
MEFPDGAAVRGSWSIPDFPAYIGQYDVAGKTLLDVGTATGYIAFNAEKAGAQVTGLEAASAREFRHVPFANALSYQNVAASRAIWEEKNLKPVKNSWWRCWHEYGSKARCVYEPIADLYEWDDTVFDIVVAGAIVEHLSDPVFSIGAWCKVAREAVIIPFTDVADSDALAMVPMTAWTDQALDYEWWSLTRGLYNRIFDNCGFDVDYKSSTAFYNDVPSGAMDLRRPTIIARRRR